MSTLLNYTRCPAVPTPSSIAHQLGLIEEELRDEPGIAPVYRSVGFSPQLEFSHDERFWIRNAGHAPAVWKRSKGVDCVMVGLSFLEGSYPVLTLAASGIGSVADLKGKRLAVIGKGGSAFDLMVSQQLKIFRTALSTAGLTFDDVELVRVPAPPLSDGPGETDLLAKTFYDRLALLQEGIVDAVAGGAIPPDARDFPPLNVLYDTRLHPDPLERVNPSVLRGLVVSGPLLRERRDIVVRVLARLIEAAEWAKANPLEAIRLVAHDLSVAPERLAASYESVAQGVQFGFDEKRLGSLRVQKQFLLDQGLIDTDFDLDGWVDHTPLRDAEALLAARRAALSVAGPLEAAVH